MHIDKVIKKATGEILHYENIEFGKVIVGGNIVNPEAWKIIREREAENKKAQKIAAEVEAGKAPPQAQPNKEVQDLKKEINELKELIKNLTDK